jgi:hypothetical protein
MNCNKYDDSGVIDNNHSFVHTFWIIINETVPSWIVLAHDLIHDSLARIKQGTDLRDWWNYVDDEEPNQSTVVQVVIHLLSSSMIGLINKIFAYFHKLI